MPVLRCRPVHRRALLWSTILNPPQLKWVCEDFKLRAAIIAGDDFAFLDIVCLKIQTVLAFGTQKFVPVAKIIGSPSHDYFSFPAGGTLGKAEYLVYGRTLDVLRLSTILFYSNLPDFPGFMVFR